MIRSGQEAHHPDGLATAVPASAVPVAISLPMSRPTLGVVVPAFNRPRLLPEALGSIARQSHLPQRIVIVDDGSTDETFQVAQSWSQGQAPNLDIRVIRQPHQGQSTARNAGVEALDGIDLVAFLDSDDLWPADYLLRMVRMMEMRPDAIAASSDVLRQDTDNGRSKLHRFPEIERDTTARMIRGELPGCPITTIRTAAFRAAGGFDPSLPCAEDYHLFLRLSLRGLWVHVEGEPVVARSHDIARKSEAAHTSREGALARIVQARMLEHFIAREGGAAKLANQDWRRRVARMWYRAGQHLLSRAARPEASFAFAQARRLQPGHLRAIWFDWTSGRRSAENDLPALPHMGDERGLLYPLAVHLRLLTQENDVILSGVAPRLLRLLSERIVLDAAAPTIGQGGLALAGGAAYVVLPLESDSAPPPAMIGPPLALVPRGADKPAFTLHRLLEPERFGRAAA